MSGLPVSLNLAARRCVIIGGGAVAQRKAQMLLRFAKEICIVAPKLCASLRELIEEQETLVWLEGHYAAAQLDGAAIVIVATEKRALNRQIAADARTRNIPANVVDDPELCDFTVPSILDRDPLYIAVSSGGASPVLARLLRARLETLIPHGYGRIAHMANVWRERVRERFPDMRLRRRFWEDLLQGRVESLILAGRETEAEDCVRQALESDAPFPQEQKRGEVYLVGGGPGDPDLLTFKALRLMQQADVALYDRLVAKPILDLVRRDADLIYVGKKRDQHALPQGDINKMLVDLALEGKRVLRLKGGDPFIFGRGGEEIESLAAAGVLWQIVPGITAASGCASYAGIPLTHRDYAHTCLLVTGHLKDKRLDLNWDALLQPMQTVVIYMGTHGIHLLVRELTIRGMSPDMPAAIIERGTMPTQRVHASRLADLPALVEERQISPPSLIVIGNVVKLHASLRWYRQSGAGHSEKPFSTK
ncbi:MAG: siroheme synthase CysG [Candidatus Eutrophobiaceae bacterium]